jgi:hypothetical protein
MFDAGVNKLIACARIQDATVSQRHYEDAPASFCGIAAIDQLIDVARKCGVEARCWYRRLTLAVMRFEGGANGGLLETRSATIQTVSAARMIAKRKAFWRDMALARK